MTQEATDWHVSRYFNTDITTLRCFIAPCKGMRIPESDKFLHLKSGILEIFAFGIPNPGP